MLNGFVELEHFVNAIYRFYGLGSTFILNIFVKNILI